MTPKKIIEFVRSMRDREALSSIIWAAESRDNHLSNIESDERRKRKWAQFSHLKKGDTVFIHKRPDTASPFIGMYGKALRVKLVQKRAKKLVVDTQGHDSWTLTALTADALKLSEVPTADAFHNTLAGDDDVVARKAR